MCAPWSGYSSNLNKKVFWNSAHHELWNACLHSLHLEAWGTTAEHLLREHLGTPLRFIEAFGGSSIKISRLWNLQLTELSWWKKHSDVCGFWSLGWFSHRVILFCFGMPHLILSVGPNGCVEVLVKMGRECCSTLKIHLPRVLSLS